VLTELPPLPPVRVEALLPAPPLPPELLDPPVLLPVPPEPPTAVLELPPAPAELNGLVEPAVAWEDVVEPVCPALPVPDDPDAPALLPPTIWAELTRLTSSGAPQVVAMTRPATTTVGKTIFLHAHPASTIRLRYRFTVFLLTFITYRVRATALKTEALPRVQLSKSD
jgi:hypothetical protein